MSTFPTIIDAMSVSIMRTNKVMEEYLSEENKCGSCFNHSTSLAGEPQER